MSSLDSFAKTKLEQLEARALRRRLSVTERSTAGIAIRSGPDGAQKGLFPFVAAIIST